MLRGIAKFGLTALVVVGLANPQSAASGQLRSQELSPIWDTTPAQLVLEPKDNIDLDPVEPEPEPEPEPTPDLRPNCAEVTCVALTFDDGPHPNTLKILASLDKRGAKATFFAVGSAVRVNPEIAAEIVSRGHEIAAHSNTHKNLRLLSSWQLERDFKLSKRAIREATGLRAKLFRPPFGYHNSRVRELSGLPVVMWSVDPQDWRTRSSKRIVADVLREIHSGAIVVMHDPLTATANAVPVLLRELTARGYHLVTVSELLESPKAGQVYTQGPGQ